MKSAVFYARRGTEEGIEKEPEKNLKMCVERWYFCGMKK